MKKLTKIRLGFYILVMAVLVGCGGSSSSSSTDTTTSTVPTESRPTGTGYYVDSAIEGIDYVCGKYKGVTDSEGKFTFEEGLGCSFSLAKILLRRIDAKSLVDGKSIIEDNPKVAKFLQSIDGNSNVEDGIQINEDVIKSLTTALLEHNSVGKLPEGNVLTRVVSDIGESVDGVSGVVRTDEEVLNHIADTQKKLIKELFSDKIFYKVENIGFGSLEYLAQIIINPEITRLYSILLDGPNTGDNKTLNVVIGDRGLVIDGTYYVLTSQEKDYLVLSRFGGNRVNEGVDYYFYNQEKAEAYLNRNNDIIIPNSTDSSSNQTLVANAGVDKSVTINQTITLIGSGTDSNGTIIEYEWRNENIVLATTAQFDYLPTIVGTHTLTFSVTDDDGNLASDTVLITVKKSTRIFYSPKANAGEDNLTMENRPIKIIGIGTDTDGTIVSYEWKKEDVVLATTAKFIYTPTIVGEDNLTLKVTDNDGLSASDEVTITVTENPNKNKIDLVKYLFPKESILNQYLVYNFNGYDKDGIADETIYSYSVEELGQDFFDYSDEDEIINGIPEYKRFIDIGEIFYSYERTVSGYTFESTLQLVEELDSFAYRGKSYSGDIIKVKVRVKQTNGDLTSEGYIYYKKDRGFLAEITRSLSDDTIQSRYLENE